MASGKIHNTVGMNPIAIGSNTDLNDLTKEGAYTCAGASIATTLTNCPYTATAFTMIVLRKNTTLNTCGQLIIGGTSLYFRDSSSSGFTKWKRLQGTEVN